MHQRLLKRIFLAVFLILALLLPFSGSLASATSNRFSLPGDVQLVKSFQLPNYNLTYERYQQYFGSAKVYGGQLTQYKDGNGAVVAVIGNHYPNISPTNAVVLTAAEARSAVSRDIGPEGERIVELMIDPGSGTFFYRVETRRSDSRWFHWIHAVSGKTLNKFDALAHTCDATTAPCGFGVAYDNGDTSDVKNLTGLTRPAGSGWELRSTDGRQETHDTGSTRRPFLGPVATDSDNVWVLPGNTSPAQPALVDAQYYARVTDDYLLSKHSFDWVQSGKEDPDHTISAMVVHAHYSVSYNNAFWNGSYVAIGDGDQVSFRELTPLDVVAHEFTHGVTDFTSNLIYQDESGALNESFSDMMGNSAEFFAEAAGREPATTLQPDWLIGEDLDLRSDVARGFRNMGDPEEDGHPDHYTERYTGTDDNGGVHSNSGIPNHAYYLAIHGGQNASCASPSNHNSAHCSGDGLKTVSGIGLDQAERIFFSAFIGLPENATMCDARKATETAASTLYPSALQSITDAWVVVGLTDAVCGSSGGGGGTGISLSVSAYKVSGLQKADLTWSGATSTNIYVYRDGVVIATTENDGFYTDNINRRGGGSYTYKVCEAGSTTCSNEVTITF